MRKTPDAVPQFQTLLPPVLTAPCENHASVDPRKVFAQDETRLGFLPVVRRRMTACGVQPVATVVYQFDHCSLSGAVEPTTGAHVFLAWPSLNSRAFPLWWDGVAASVPDSLNIRVRDNGAGHKAQAVQGPATVVPVFLPPSSPALTPMERLWRALQETRADIPTTPITELSDARCATRPNSSHATLQSLTSFAYFVHTVETVPQASYGSLPIRNRIIKVLAQPDLPPVLTEYPFLRGWSNRYEFDLRLILIGNHHFFALFC